jgi:hypothetical protein
MAIVIDEVQVEPAAQPTKRDGHGSDGQGGGEEKQKPSPEELARAIEWQHERHERVRAY